MLFFIARGFHCLSCTNNNNPSLRYDGFYQTRSDIDTVKYDTCYYYLWLYPDCKVISVTSSGTAGQVKKWFNLCNKNISTRHVSITAGRLYFSTTDDNGTLVYDGTITDAYHLELSATSLINGHAGRESFYFIKVSLLQ